MKRIGLSLLLLFAQAILMTGFPSTSVADKPERAEGVNEIPAFPKVPGLIPFETLMSLRPEDRRHYLQQLRLLLADLAKASVSDDSPIFASTNSNASDWVSLLFTSFISNAHAANAAQIGSCDLGDSGEMVEPFELRTAKCKHKDGTVYYRKYDESKSDWADVKAPEGDPQRDAPSVACDDLDKGKMLGSSQTAECTPKNGGAKYYRRYNNSRGGWEKAEAPGGPETVQPAQPAQPAQPEKPAEPVAAKAPDAENPQAAETDDGLATPHDLCLQPKKGLKWTSAPGHCDSYKSTDPKAKNKARAENEPCFYAGNLSRYVKSPKGKLVCARPSEICADYTNPLLSQGGTCASSSDTPLKCEKRGEVACAPVPFGLERPGKPFCVKSTGGATKACFRRLYKFEKEHPDEDPMKFLDKEKMKQAWATLDENLKKVCNSKLTKEEITKGNCSACEAMRTSLPAMQARVEAALKDQSGKLFASEPPACPKNDRGINDSGKARPATHKGNHGRTHR